jgi:NADPH oxidase
MGLGAKIKKQATGQKLLFNILFWGAHWGVFAFGW